MTVINASQVSIDTVVPTLSIGQIQLSADRRSTKEKPLTDAERIRRVVLPANHWGNYSASIEGTMNQSLTDVLRTALVSIASDYLRDQLAAEPMLRVLPLSAFTVPALLAWNSESASSRGGITFTRDQVEGWIKTSATLATATAKWQAAGKTAAQVTAMAGFLTNRFATLAAKNHGLKETSDIDKLVALLDPADLEGESASLVTEVMGRLEHIRKQLTAKAAEATVSMDDL